MQFFSKCSLYSYWQRKCDLCWLTYFLFFHALFLNPLLILLLRGIFLLDVFLLVLLLFFYLFFLIITFLLRFLLLFCTFPPISFSLPRFFYLLLWICDNYHARRLQPNGRSHLLFSFLEGDKEVDEVMEMCEFVSQTWPLSWLLPRNIRWKK